MGRPRFTQEPGGLAILATSLVSTIPAIADFPFVGQVCDTVDGIQSDSDLITVTGIVVGQSTATTSSYRGASSPSQDGVGALRPLRAAGDELDLLGLGHWRRARACRGALAACSARRCT